VSTFNEAARLGPKTTADNCQRRTAVSLRLKRAMDILGSTTLLLITWPLFLLIALAVKLDSPGPVLFRRRVVGQHGKLFDVLKFRSMVANAHELLLRDPEPYSVTERA
jgi:lipopolysaccharide/colanic/teichoic acid biosynthesis glycosyltransferase